MLFVVASEALCTTSCSVPPWLFKTMFWLGYCNSMMNPVIYAFASREFKQAFLRIIICRCRRRDHRHNVYTEALYARNQAAIAMEKVMTAPVAVFTHLPM